MKGVAAWGLAATVALTAAGCTSATKWTGTISDDDCGAYHVWDEHGPPLSERECTLICVKRGASFVLVVDGQVHPIANQAHPDLERAAGLEVMLTGRMTDGTIHVDAIDLSPSR